MNTILGAAVIGLGVGEQHAKAYAMHPQVSPPWLLDIDRGHAESVAARISGARVAASFEQLLGDSAVSIISIASFDDAHYGQVARALEAGKHVFVEKPLCQNLTQLAEIRRIWSAAGGRLKLGSNLILRAAPLYRWLHQAVADGEFGEIYAFDGDYLYGRLHKITEGWRREVSDYSVMQGGGIHLIDLMLWLTRQRPLTVTAVGNRISSRDSRFRYNDFCAATLSFESGMVGRITANYGCVHRHHHVMRIFGTHKTFLYDDAGARLHESRDPAAAPAPILHAPLPSGKGDMIAGFIESILEDMDITDDTQSVFDGISVAIACDRAAASGRIEKVEYV